MVSQKIIDEILDGMYEAHRIQWERAGNIPFNPVESVYQSCIANIIYKPGFNYVHYEYNVSDIIKELDILSSNDVTASNGKIDLLIKNKEKQPSVIIEIKAEYAQKTALDKDIFRICDLLNNRAKGKCPNLFGVFAFSLVRFQASNIRKHIVESFDAMEINIIKPNVMKKNCKYNRYERKFEDKGNIVWGANCYEIFY